MEIGGEAKPSFQEDPREVVPRFREAVVRWFEEEGRSFPWRETEDPYAILVSELMLQQTRVETVLQRNFFGRWMEAFPTMETLAQASEEEILKCWEGLGYYRRARFLQKAAQAVVDQYGGTFPSRHEEILALPGVGAYTAGAVSAFAFNRAAPMVDGNVARVLTRLFDSKLSIDETEGKRRLEDWSAELVDPQRARLFQSGIMELGQVICRARKPLCGQCPVSSFCQTREPETLPRKKKSAKPVEVDEWVYWVKEGDKVFLEEEDGSRRRGLYRLPQTDPAQGRGREILLSQRYAITKYKVTMRVVEGHAEDVTEREGKWCGASEREAVALGAPYRRVLETLLQREAEGDLFS